MRRGFIACSLDRNELAVAGVATDFAHEIPLRLEQSLLSTVEHSWQDDEVVNILLSTRTPDSNVGVGKPGLIHPAFPFGEENSRPRQA